MKRLGLLGLLLVAMCAFGGATASSSLAVEQCLRTVEPQKGNWQDAQCTIRESPGGNYIRVNEPGIQTGNGLLCAKVIEPATGNFMDSICSIPQAGGEFIRVYDRGNVWHRQGKKLWQGETAQVKLQSKSGLVLKTPLLAVEVECKNSVSEGATIEGSSANIGQGKGRVTYTQCTVLKPVAKEGTCKVAEPITTNQLKSFLATATPNQEKPKQAKIVNVFEPTQGVTFAILKFSKECGATIAGERGVNGAIAAELVPVGKEGQEGLIAFPSEAITAIKYQEQERKLKLEAIGMPATFSGAYGARLANNEQWGVFEE